MLFIKHMKEQREGDRGRKGSLAVPDCWQKNSTDRCIWLSFAPIQGVISRMHFLEACFCSDKSVSLKKKQPEESYDSKYSAVDVHSLPEAPSSTSLPLCS